MSVKDNELVLCVKTSTLNDLIDWSGAIFDDSFCSSDGLVDCPASAILQSLDAAYRRAVVTKNTEAPLLEEGDSIGFVPRGTCETAESLRQIIPYTLLSVDNQETADWELLSYWRGEASTEERLHGHCSIGVGGHVNPCDTASQRHHNGLYDVLRCCRNREVQEELELDWQTVVFPELECRLVGLILDNSNEVGRVHFGLVYEHFLVSKTISPKEDAIKTLEFMSVDDQKANYEYMEPWSQIVYRYLEKEEVIRREFLEKF